jgi:hypothetical protein
VSRTTSALAIPARALVVIIGLGPPDPNALNQPVHLAGDGQSLLGEKPVQGSDQSADRGLGSWKAVRTAVEETRARVASVESLCPEDFKVTNILGEQATLFRHRQIQYLRIEKSSAFGLFDDGDDVVSPLAKSLGEQGREHLV